MARALFCEVLRLCCSRTFKLLVIDEQFELLFLWCRLRFLVFADDVACRDVEPAGEQARVDDRIEELERSVDDEA